MLVAFFLDQRLVGVIPSEDVEVRDVVLLPPKHLDFREQVLLERGVERRGAALAGEVVLPQRAVAAGIPLQHIHPGGVGIDPDVQPLGEELLQRLGLHPRDGGHAAQILRIDRYAIQRVRLAPGALVEIVVAFVDGVDDPPECLIVHRFALDAVGEAAVTLEHGVEYLRQIPAHVIAHAGAVRAGGRDRPQQRLSARAAAGIEHVVHRARLVRVQLIDHGAAHVQTIQAVRVGRERPEARCRFHHGHRLFVDLHAKPGAEIRGDPRHLLRDLEHNARLLFLRRRAVDLRADLTVGDEHIQRDRRELGRLRVLARHFLVHGAKAPPAVCLTHPAEHACEAEFLRRHQHDQRARFPCAAALDVRAQLDETDHAVRQVGPPFERPRRVRLPAREVVELAAACRLHPLARRDLARQHLVRVLDRLRDMID